MMHLSALALLRRATWRRLGVALALAALLAQALAVAMPMQASAAPWGDATICHSPGSDAAATDAGGGEPDRGGHPSCPLCLALQHLGKLLPPAAAAILQPPAATRLAVAPRADDALAARIERPHLPRGPPISG